MFKINLVVTNIQCYQNPSIIQQRIGKKLFKYCNIFYFIPDCELIEEILTNNLQNALVKYFVNFMSYPYIVVLIYNINNFCHD